MATGEGIRLADFTAGTEFSDDDYVYMTQDGATVKGTVAQLKTAVAISATQETFVAGDGVIPGTYLPGASSITLTGTYGSINDLDVYADAVPQLDCTLSGQALGFNPTIPAGNPKIIVRGKQARSIGVPADASVTDVKVAPASKVYNRINDIYSITDKGMPVTGTTFSSAVADIQAAGGGLLHMYGHDSIAPPSNYAGVLLEYDGPNTPINLFQLSGETIWFAQKVFSNQINVPHTGHGYSVLHVENQPKGSGLSGPTNADYALTISHLKQGFGSGTAMAGEMDGMYIVVRNDGGNSDTAAILGDVGQYGIGFNAFFESVTSGFVSGALTYQIDAQAGVIDTRNHVYAGFVATATVGALTTGILVQSNSGAGWTNLFEGQHNGGVIFSIDTLGSNGSGRINLYDGVGGLKTLRTSSNSLSILNAVGAEIFNLNDSGLLVIPGSLKTGVVVLNGTLGSGVAGTLTLGSATAASASAGGASLPSAPAGFLTGFSGTTAIKIPYYNS